MRRSTVARLAEPDPRSFGVVVFAAFAVVEASLSVATAVESAVVHVLLDCPAGFAGSPCGGFVSTGVPDLVILAPLVLVLGGYVAASPRVGVSRQRAVVVLFSALALMLLGQGTALTALSSDPTGPPRYASETIAAAQLASLAVFAATVGIGTVGARR